MTTIHDVLKNLNPLKRAQYYLLFSRIEYRPIKFNTDCQKEVQKALGLTWNEFKKALQWLIDQDLVLVEVKDRQLVFSITDFGRDIF